jgi:Kef-type K+ transport system membrane component KefB
LDLLFKLSIVIFIGIIGGRIANYFKLPNVSGYIIGGLLIGPSFLNLIKAGEAADFNIVNEVALAAIAFSIGSEFLLKDIIKTGKDVLIITVAEVMGAVILVFLVTYFIFKQSFEFSLVIASMSAATAPAGILMVIRELKAQGPLVRTILPVVAIDDAIGIMVFGISMSIAKLTSGVGSFSIIQIIWAPLFEIIGSLLLGGILGFLLSYLAPKARGRDELLSMVLGFILIGTGAANYLEVSPLLTCMALGAMLINLMQNANRVFNLIADFTPPIYLLFFTLAGASLNLSVLTKVGALGIGYILARAVGKVIGATLGAKYVNCDEKVTKYLGMSLLTQGGISIGLSMIVSKELPQFSESIITVILFSVLIYEIAGPILAKIAIQKAGEESGALRKRSKADMA